MDRTKTFGYQFFMNMWGLTPDFISILDQGFTDFLSKLPAGDTKSEYLLPIIIGDLLEKGEVSVKVLETPDKWFGVTYQEDRQAVMEAFQELIEKGVYSSPL